MIKRLKRLYLDRYTTSDFSTHLLDTLFFSESGFDRKYFSAICYRLTRSSVVMNKLRQWCDQPINPVDHDRLFLLRDGKHTMFNIRDKFL